MYFVSDQKLNSWRNVNFRLPLLPLHVCRFSSLCGCNLSGNVPPWKTERTSKDCSLMTKCLYFGHLCCVLCGADVSLVGWIGLAFGIWCETLFCQVVVGRNEART